MTFISVTAGGNDNSNDNSNENKSQLEHSHMGSSQQGNSFRVTMHGEEVETEQINKEFTGGEKEYSGGLDLRTAAGDRVTDKRNLDFNTVNIQAGSTRCSLEVAIQQDLVSVDNAGNIVESAKLQEMNQKFGQKQTSRQDLIKPEFRSTMDTLYKRAGLDVVNNSMTQLYEHAILGTDPESTLTDFAQRAGADPDSLQRFAESYIGSLIDTGVEYIAKDMGKPVGQVFDFIQNRLEPAEKTRLLLALHHGDHTAMAFVKNKINGKG